MGLCCAAIALLLSSAIHPQAADSCAQASHIKQHVPAFAYQRSGFLRAMSDAGLKPTVVHHNLTPAELYEQVLTLLAVVITVIRWKALSWGILRGCGRGVWSVGLARGLLEECS